MKISNGCPKLTFWFEVLHFKIELKNEKILVIQLSKIEVQKKMLRNKLSFSQLFFRLHFKIELKNEKILVIQLSKVEVPNA